jgi:hypothetical protein
VVDARAAGVGEASGKETAHQVSAMVALALWGFEGCERGIEEDSAEFVTVGDGRGRRGQC